MIVTPREPVALLVDSGTGKSHPTAALHAEPSRCNRYRLESPFVVDRLERGSFMVKVGDRIRLSSGKGPDREGVVTGMTGSMLRVRWPSEQETTVIPAPGTLAVLASSGDQAPPAGRPKRAATKKAATSKKSSSAQRTASTKTDGTKKSRTSKKAATGKRGATKKIAGTKRSSR